MIYSETIQKALGSWSTLFKPFIESEEMDKIFSGLKAETAKGKKVAPLSKDVFKCFQSCKKDNLRCIIVGTCPYANWEGDNPVADGLCLSCSYTAKTKGLQPSLRLWYEELTRIYGMIMDKDNLYYGNTMNMAEQGVLCYNIALTTEEAKPMSHEPLWREFNKFFFTEVIGNYYKGIPIIFLGEEAKKSMKYLNPLQHYLLPTSHPASVAHSGKEEWNSGGVFQKVDEILWNNNKTKIMWVDDMPF